jgi:hypothetical protein
MKCDDGACPVYFNSFDDAESWGYPEEACDCIALDEVPDCAKTGNVICQGDMAFIDLCFAEKHGMQKEECDTL